MKFKETHDFKEARNGMGPLQKAKLDEESQSRGRRGKNGGWKDFHAFFDG